MKSQKIYFHTFGCKTNQYETQSLREYLSGMGGLLCREAEDADLIVINSCTVTAEADRQCRQLIRQLSRRNPRARIIVTGCYAARAKDELKSISEKIEIPSDRSEMLLPGAGTAKAPAAVPITVFEGHSRAFVKIQDGCDAFCSYCVVPFVRPELWSRTEQDIISEVMGLVSKKISGNSIDRHQAWQVFRRPGTTS